MAEIGITKMSSKGQIVIPKEMRSNIKEGEKLLIIQGDGSLILKKANKMDQQFKEDLEFSKRTEEAYKRIERGEFISVDSENLVEEMMKW
jgi:AbrB family looped-hinge helix DNA binding protein